MAAPSIADLLSLLQANLRVGQPIVLRETNPKATQQQVTLRGTETGSPTLGLHFETGHSALSSNPPDLPTWLFPLFTGSGGPRKSCDYVVLRETALAIDILLVELKSTKADEARLQIANTRLLIDHLLDAAAHWHGGSPPAQSRTARRRFRGILFKNPGSAKKVSGAGAKVTFVPMPGMLDVDWTTLPYREQYHIRQLLP